MLTEIKNLKKAAERIKKAVKKGNFPSLINREFIYQTIGDESDCRNFVEDWIKYKGEIRTFGDIVLE